MTPGWPNFYPELDFQCKWFIDVNETLLDNETRMVLEFTFNTSAFGFGSQSNCHRDYIEFYDGLQPGGVAAVKVCSSEPPEPFTLSSTQARILFRGSSIAHIQGQIGAMVYYTTIEQGKCCLAGVLV